MIWIAAGTDPHSRTHVSVQRSLQQQDQQRTQEQNDGASQKGGCSEVRISSAEWAIVNLHRDATVMTVSFDCCNPSG